MTNQPTTDQPKPESPIIAHNRKLCIEVMTRTKTHSRYPKVTEQLECLPLETEKLKKFGYNPTINAKGWMVYRAHAGMASTKLSVAQLHPDGNGKVFSDRALNLSSASDEDARLFTFQGDDYLCWVQSTYPTQPLTSVVKYAKFKDMQLGDVVQPKIGRNDGTILEKNFVPFEYDGRLMMIYRCHPTHRVYDLTASTNIDTIFHETEGPRWAFGEIRGGTPPLPYEGKLLRFFHSRITNEFAAPGFRYLIGAMLISPEPPFEVLRVSKRPIVYGSEVDSIKRNERPFHWKANVAFCSGAIETTGGFIVSIGTNDAACVLGKITPSQFNF